jgi:histidyl-tRNA synthetase
MGERAVKEAQKLAYSLRQEGISVDTDHLGRGLRASMKYADKLGALNTLVLGDNEIDTGIVKVKNMSSGEETEIALDKIADFFRA